MFIDVKKTPNKNSLMFCFKGFSLDENNKDVEDKIKEISGVVSVLVSKEFVSVNKEEDEDWDFLKPSILSVITNVFVEKKTQVKKNPKPKTKTKRFEIVNELINSKIRPGVQMDGGDIVLKDVTKDGVVLISMIGACDGCQSSEITLKQGIERVLKHFCDFVVEVRKVD